MTKSAINVLISGGSGTLGKAITKLLQNNNCKVGWLTRKSIQYQGVKCFVWNPEQGQIPEEAISFADVVINLAGANVVGQRWTNKYKQQILESRVQSTRMLVKQIINANKPIKTFISASAIGIYGQNNAFNLAEETETGTNFLAEVCRQWENATAPLLDTSTRLVVLRIGNVLSKNGGVLSEIKKPVKLGLGACLGSGKQQVSWIHEDDLVRFIWFALNHNEISGVFNIVATNPTTNETLTKAIATAMRKPLWLPAIPIWVLKLIIGDAANLVGLSQHISNKKLLSTGFNVRYQTINEAIKDLI